MATNHAAMTAPVFDAAILQQLPASLRAIAPEMIAAGLRDIDEQCAIVHACTDGEDTLPVVGAMHSIKSCAAQLGGLALSHFAAEKEAALRQGETFDRQQVEDALAAHVAQFKAALKVYQSHTVT